MNKAFATTALNKWQRYTWHEKASIVYVLLLFVFLIFAPLIRIDQINSTTSQVFTLVNTSMIKTFFIIFCAWVFLIAWNSSYTWKQWLHRTFGYSSNAGITNALVLFLILLMLFTLWDTITLISENFSPRIAATRRFLFLGIYLIAWIARQLAITRIAWKKQTKASDVSIKKEVDVTKKEREFEKIEKEFQGLFENDKEW